MPHFEHRDQPLLPRWAFYRRVLNFVGFSALILLGALGIGVVGYRLTEGMSWLDAFLNASMILGGMGPVDLLHTTAGKVFAGCYALFSGVIFLVSVGVMLTPGIHRLLHRLHVEESEKDS